MRAVQLLAVAALVVTAGGAAATESEAEARARAELERELGKVVASPPPRLELSLLEADDPNFELVEVTLALDGKPLPTKPPQPGLERSELFAGEAPEGPHHLRILLRYRVAESYGREGKFAVEGGTRFYLRRGLALGIEARLRVNEDEPDYRKRFGVSITTTPRMTGAVDDGSLPPPRERPPLVAAAAPPDAPEELPPPPPPPPVEAAPPPPPVPRQPRVAAADRAVPTAPVEPAEPQQPALAEEPALVPPPPLAVLPEPPARPAPEVKELQARPGPPIGLRELLLGGAGLVLLGLVLLLLLRRGRGPAQERVAHDTPEPPAPAAPAPDGAAAAPDPQPQPDEESWFDRDR